VRDVELAERVKVSVDPDQPPDMVPLDKVSDDDFFKAIKLESK
jgi:hypothetical protein